MSGLASPWQVYIYTYLFPHRTFISLNRYKEAIALDSMSHLNLYLVPLMEVDTMGLAAYPWHSEALTTYGL